LGKRSARAFPKEAGTDRYVPSLTAEIALDRAA
jgi:hypothetical protein